MQLTSVFNAPRYVDLGGERYWVGALRIADYALLAAWLDDILPGREERKFPPAISADESWAKLTSAEGLCHVAYAALRHQGLSWAQSANLILKSTQEERQRLFEVLLSRRRGIRNSTDSQDLAEVWWGPVVAALAEGYHMTPEQVGNLTLDQLDALVSKGCEDERPAGTGSLMFDEVVTMWADARAKWEQTATPEEIANAPA